MLRKRQPNPQHPFFATRIHFAQALFPLAMLPVLAVVIAAGATMTAAQGPVRGAAGIALQGPTAGETPCGSWQVVNSPNPTEDSNYIFGMEVVSPTEIWAVGNYIVGQFPNPSIDLALALRWNGTEWHGFDTPNPSDRNNWLYDAAAITSDDVWAVGAWFNQGQTEMLGMHWDGTQWTLASPSGLGQLNAVSAVASNDVWAVGSFWQGSVLSTRIVRWNGTKWNIVSSPNLPGVGNALFSVTAVSANDVWAVGRSGNHPDYHSLVTHWDGTEWSVVSHPDIGYIWSVDAVSPNDIWAVGGSTLHWNGTAWTQVPVTLPADSLLQGVTAISANDVWATGYYVGGTGTQTLMRHWDGASWSEVPSFDADNFNVLVAIDAVSSDEVWAVGHASPGGGLPYRTMTGRFTASQGCATPTHTSTPTQPPVVTVTRTATPTATATTIPCAITFTDVQTTDYFYEPVRYLFCLGAISGYADNTFRPFNYTTRGQLTKIVALAEGWELDTTGGPHFTDVPQDNPFYGFIETVYNREIISGYSCGGPGEPCPGLYFRWGSNVTRGQLAKIIVLAEAWPSDTTGGPHFNDVPPDHPFYEVIETAFNREIISGYADGTFRPGSNATRGQIAKIVHSAVSGDQ